MGLLVRSSSTSSSSPSTPSLLRIAAGVAIALGVGVTLTWAVSKATPEREKSLVLLAPASGKLIARMAAEEDRSDVTRPLAQPASLVMPMAVEWMVPAQWEEPVQTAVQAPAAARAVAAQPKPAVTVARAAPMPVPRPRFAVQMAAYDGPVEIAPPVQRQAPVEQAEPGLLRRASALVTAPVGSVVNVASGAADTVVAAGRWTAGAVGGLIPRW